MTELEEKIWNLVHGWCNDQYHEIPDQNRRDLMDRVMGLVNSSPGNPLPDKDNYDYLRGFCDGYGGEEPHDSFPEGFNDINTVHDRMWELKNKAE